MDARALLDYALFQLTPTRTRCDLVVFASGASEKVASGLLEPFLSHLRSAKEQISRGGYSITLRPPSTAAGISWFTKATLQRFVRFVSSPEVLERFVTIEREIEQIESSVQTNELPCTVMSAEADASDGYLKMSAASSKSKGESNGVSDNAPEENSKARLQHVLQTRMAVLRKEQAMSYARALVAGFEMEYIDDLISFANAFGASRLREACVNFIELCKRKNDDGLWMDELAAMQACSRSEFSFLGTSGIVLAGEDNDPNQNISINVPISGLSGAKLNGSIDASVTDSSASHGSLDVNHDTSLPTSAQMPPADEKARVPMSWPNHLPQYMNNFQGPVFQQMPSYQGYVFPGMHVPPPYYPGNMQWPPNMEDSGFGLDQRQVDRRRHRSSSRHKEKHSHRKGPETSEQDVSTESTESGSESGSDEYLQHKKKHFAVEHQHKKKDGKKSSRKVVIRNINYITSKRDGERSDSEGNSSGEADLIDGDSLKQRVEEAVGSLERHHKTSTHHKKRHGSKHLKILNGSKNAANKNSEDVPASNSGGVTHDGSSHWDAFQNLLMRDEESRMNNSEPLSAQFREENFTAKSSEGMPSAFHPESEKVQKQRAVSTDSFLVIERHTVNEDKNHTEGFEPAENFRSLIKNMDSTYEELIFSRRSEKPGNYSQEILSNCASESSIIKSRNDGDWFIGHQTDKLNQDESINIKMFDGDYASAVVGDGFCIKENNKDVLADDSFMVQARSVFNEEADSQLRTDIRMVTDMIGASQHENSMTEVLQDKVEAFGATEPNDLCMVLQRSSSVDHAGASWTPEIDFENDISLDEAHKMRSDVETTDCIDSNPLSNGKGTNKKNSLTPEGKTSFKERRPKGLGESLGRSKSEVTSRSRKPSSTSRMTVHKSKSEKEEENRKKMEEILIQRQKRIAERSAASGITPTTSRRASMDNKIAVTSKSEKPKIQSPTPDVKMLVKPVMKSSTIDRLAAARTNPEVSSVQLKSGQAKKATLKANGVVSSTSSQKTSGTESNKPTVKKVKPLNKKISLENPNSSLPSISDNQGKNDDMCATAALATESSHEQAVQFSNGIIDYEDTKLHGTPSIENNMGNFGSQTDTLDYKRSKGNSNSWKEDSSLPTVDGSAQVNSLKGDGEQISEVSMIHHEDKALADKRGELIPEVTVDPLPASPNAILEFTALNIHENGAANENFPISSEISEIEVSTPPPTNGMDTEPGHSRRKWNSGETSPKAAKGFRKLLLFGRKSRNSPTN